jgi:hypothetical protein
MVNSEHKEGLKLLKKKNSVARTVTSIIFIFA